MGSWTHDYCLACDTQTDGSVYCSEACRLADYDPSSVCSSPSSFLSNFTWDPSTLPCSANNSNNASPVSPYSTYDFSSPQSFFRSAAAAESQWYSRNRTSSQSSSTYSFSSSTNSPPTYPPSNMALTNGGSSSSSTGSNNSNHGNFIGYHNSNVGTGNNLSRKNSAASGTASGANSGLSMQNKLELQSYALAFAQVRKQRGDA